MSEETAIQIRTDNYFAAFPHWVLDKRLSSSAIHLYLALLSFANWETRMGRPSRKTLATLMNCSIKTVDRAKDELVENGLLTYTRRTNDSNYYTVITANPHSDKNDISQGGRDKNDIPRGDKNDTLTRINNNNKDAEPNGSAIKNLMTIFYENYTGALEPSRGQTAGQLQNALKKLPYEQLAQAVKQLALEGQMVSTNTLIQVLRREQVKAEPTPTPPPFVAEQRNEATPMPKELLSLVQEYRKKAL